MRFKLFLVVFALCLAGSWSQGLFDKCTLDETYIDVGGLKISYDAITDVESLNLVISYTGNVDVSTPDDNDTGAKFIDATIDKDAQEILITTNAYFTEHFDEEIGPVTASTAPILRTIQVSCDADETVSLTLTLYVRDTNNQPPKFNASSYDYTMPMPLVPRVDLTVFGDPIIVEDLDFSVGTVTFSIDPADKFLLDAERIGETKQWRAILKVTEFTRYDTAQVLTITANDGVNEQLATINIEKDDSISLPPDVPKFSELIYEYNYSDEGGTPTITPVDPNKEIRVTTSDSAATEVTISDATYITATYDKGTGIVAIAASGTPVPATTSQVLTLTLTITLGEQTSEAAILVQLPIVLEVPRFEQPYYTGLYTFAAEEGDDAVALDGGLIKIAQTDETADVSIDPVDANFELTREAEGWSVNVKARVPHGSGPYVLTLRATVDDVDDGFGTLIINLPQTPKFSQPVYEYNYSEDDEGKPVIAPVDPSKEITVTTDDPSATLVALSDGTYVTATYDQDTNIVSIEPSGTTVPPTSDPILSLTLTVTFGGESSQAGIIVRLSSDVVVTIPTFTKPYYKATYHSEGPTVTLDEAEEIAITENVPDLEITLDGDEYFSISKVGETWTLGINQDLGSTILDKGGDYIVTLHATVTDDQSIPHDGFGAVVIKLPVVLEVPRFSQGTYEGTYESATNTVSLSNGPIQIVQTDETAEVTIVDTGVENFELTPRADGWTVNVVVPLDADVVQSGIPFVLQLQATVEDVSPGFSTLVINLPPPVGAPALEQAHYTATYHAETSPHSITLDAGPIGVTAGAEVTLKPEPFAESLNLDRGQGGKGLSIRLPAPPRFLKPLYNVEYKEDGQNEVTLVVTDGPINITEPDMLPILEFHLSGSYSDYFAFQMDDNPQINLRKPLDESIIKENQMLVFTLGVYYHGSSEIESTVVSVKLPHKDPQTTLKFNQPSYIFSYADDSIDQNGQIISVPNGEGAMITISDGPHKELFDVTPNPSASTYTLTAKSPLEEILDDELDVLLVLEATLPGFDDGFATVLINLPKKSSCGAPKFASSSYSAEYVSGQDTARLTTDEEITFSFGTNPDVTIAGTEAEKFEVVSNGDGTFDVRLKEGAFLDDAVLIGEADLVLTLQAKTEGVSAVGESALVIKLPKETAPAAFSQAAYEGTYDADADPNTIAIDGPIEISGNYLDETTVTLVVPADYESYFTLVDTNKPLYDIHLEKDLVDTVLATQHEIVLTLEATLTGSNLKTTTTVVIKLPALVQNVVPRFSRVFYYGTYTQNADPAQDTVAISPDLITIATDHASETSVTVVDTYSSNFKASFDGASWVLEVVDKLSEVVLAGQEIIVTLQAELVGSGETGSASLVLTLPSRPLEAVPLFDQPIYTAEYEVGADGTPVLARADPIGIEGARADAVVVQLDGNYADNLNLEKNTDNKWILSLTDQKIDDATLKDNAELVILLTGHLDNSVADGTATLVVKLLVPSVSFGQSFYEGTYIQDTTEGDSVTSDITVAGGAEVTIAEGDPLHKFDIDCPGTTCTLTTSGLDADVLATQDEIILVLKATRPDVAAEATATIVISLPLKEVLKAPEFTQTSYRASYKDDTGTPLVEVPTPIQIKGLTDLTGIVIDWVGDNRQYFEIAADGDHFTVEPKDVPADVINSGDAIVFTLEATNADVKVPGEATLVIDLPKTDSEAVTLSQRTYTATYVINDADDDVNIDNGPITFEGETDFTNADIHIKEDDEFKDYFDLTFETDHWTLTVAQDLLKEVTDRQSSLLLTLVASIRGHSGEFSLVINLPKEGVSATFYFTDTVYLSDYDLVNGLVVVETLTLEGTIDDTPTLDITGDHAELFEATYADNIVTVTADTISQDILDENVALSLEVVATSGTEEATTRLVVRLPKTQGEAVLSFTEVAYVGSYEIVSGGNDVVKLDPPIRVADIDPTTAIPVIEESAYQQYFSFSAEKDHWVVAVAQNLPASITDVEISIYMTLKATKGDTSGEAGLVLKLPKKVVPTSFSFPQISYTSQYVIDASDFHSIKVAKNITIEGDPEHVVDVTLGGDYKQYFESFYEGELVEVALNGKLPDTILDTLTVINVDVIGTKVLEVARSTLIVQLPEKFAPVTFYFDETTYIADYSTTGDTPTITIDEEISLEGDEDGSATIQLNGDYKDNFVTTYADGKLQLALTDPLPAEVLNSESAISLEIEATRNGEDTKTTLVIKLPKVVRSTDDGGSGSGSDTGLIAAVAVLAVLLVASLVGSAVFYYFKFRRGNNSAMLDDGRPSERFRKNSNNPEEKRFGHPTRRATGVIRLPLTDEVVGETPTEFEPADKRKSVQFDTINIDEREIEKSEDPDDTEEDSNVEYEKIDEESDDGNEDDSDLRRTSRV